MSKPASCTVTVQQLPDDSMVPSSNIVVDLTEEDPNGLILSDATIVLPGVVHLDNPHDDQSGDTAEPAQHKAQLAHVLQVNALQHHTHTYASGWSHKNLCNVQCLSELQADFSTVFPFTLNPQLTRCDVM